MVMKQQLGDEFKTRVRDYSFDTERNLPEIRRRKANMHQNFVDLNPEYSAGFKDRTKKFAAKKVEQIGVVIKERFRVEHRKIFNHDIRHGYRLNYAQLRDLDKTLKADYMSYIFEKDQEVQEYAKNSLATANLMIDDCREAEQETEMMVEDHVQREKKFDKAIRKLSMNAFNLGPITEFATSQTVCLSDKDKCWACSRGVRCPKHYLKTNQTAHCHH